MERGGGGHLGSLPLITTGGQILPNPGGGGAGGNAAAAAASSPGGGSHILPQHVITSGTRRDCIRLRGLPYEAQVEHILEFLGEHAKNIVYQGVHMVYNAQVCWKKLIMDKELQIT